MSYRFRLEGELLVLQVCEYKQDYGYSVSRLTWRDAKVADIPVRDPFARDPAPDCQVHYPRPDPEFIR
jgi:hypothetical protein